MQTEENRSIKIDVNLNAMMKNFGEVFSGERIWIRELLQNTRRAGATRINIHTDRSDPNYFRIDDNGSGVSDFQALLTLGSSGWEPEVIEQENPFGMGFYAALYAAVTVEIRSRGQRAVLHSGRILSGEPITLQTCEIQSGTSIILHLKKSIIDGDRDGSPQGMKQFFERLKESLEAIVRGFPVPVYLNTEQLRRPFALDVWRGLRFDLPDGVALVELNPEFDSTTKGVTFLQGLVISNAEDGLRTWPNFSRSGLRVYMHLSGDRWRVRVPDRDRLYQSTNTSERVKTLQEKVVKAAANHIKASGEAQKYFECLLEWGCYEVIQDLPIPASRWGQLIAPMHLRHYEYEDQEDSFGSPVEIPAAGKERYFLKDRSNLYPSEETLDHLFAMYVFGFPILDTWSDPDHWFSKSPFGEEIEAFYKREVSASANQSDIVAEGAWWGKRVVVCKQFSLTLEGYGTKEITEDAFLNDTFWIIDRPLDWGYPIDQAFYFQTDGDDFDESGFDAAMENFRANLAIIKGDPAALIQSALRDYAEALEGGRFVVEAKQGAIRVEALR
ncbi:ATP-binding protein [Candidatus Manganitrophus noduliformans]|uniref:ATP-binding protein n=1 Tax=Candidatus Manganitrophus noduliformans TaxID=2606439 RepID=A0A7X6IAB5_9BACT|nr:ATP-binding protein [Candidatus Manganitrophus noduliformans]NKE70209.1 hypothetical protein [Candidatus Manganitrophus noduliformans]